MAKIWLFHNVPFYLKNWEMSEKVDKGVFKLPYLEKCMVTKVLKFHSDTSNAVIINMKPEKGQLWKIPFRLLAHSETWLLSRWFFMLLKFNPQIIRIFYYFNPHRIRSFVQNLIRTASASVSTLAGMRLLIIHNVKSGIKYQDFTAVLHVSRG